MRELLHAACGLHAFHRCPPKRIVRDETFIAREVCREGVPLARFCRYQTRKRLARRAHGPAHEGRSCNPHLICVKCLYLRDFLAKSDMLKIFVSAPTLSNTGIKPLETGPLALDWLPRQCTENRGSNDAIKGMEQE
ncbi:hypothetical protein [Candidatus Burkholderia verschuerenii]|uniref:hypothetical protein n=1 Tax=Candidatus Burkholderia verschuerenii TaxID=242163 RepID=UPI0012EDAA2A|nr:hypothetical protein [Candidatus Burkholderia verschuerenii]